jgi:predicted negative regulator of RcsB-dependent stress response
MKHIQKTGLGIFLISILVFIATLSMSNYRLTQEVLEQTVSDSAHYEAIYPAVQDMFDREYTSKFPFIDDFKSRFNALNQQYKDAQE